MGIDQSTEEKILTAAADIFHTKGFDGARMQEIAGHAGINKGLLHYYFKTKDALFEAVFSIALNRMISRILTILEMDLPLDQKIGTVVDTYMALLLKNPNLPRFVLNELNKNADQFIKKHFSSEVKMAFEHFVSSVQDQAGKKKIRPIDARQLFINMMSLILFPFIGRPLLQVVVSADKDEYMELMAARKEHIKSFIMNALTT